jgi:hypothetical protein
MRAQMVRLLDSSADDILFAELALGHGGVPIAHMVPFRAWRGLNPTEQNVTRDLSKMFRRPVRDS